MLKSFTIKIKSQNQSENSLEKNSSNSLQNLLNSVQNDSDSVQNASNSVQNDSNSEQNSSNSGQNSKISKQLIRYLLQAKKMSWKEWIYTAKNLIYSISLQNSSDTELLKQNSLLNHFSQPEINLLLDNFVQPEVLEFIRQKTTELYVKSVNYIKLAESLYSDMYDIIKNKRKYEDLIQDHSKEEYSKIHLCNDGFLQLIDRKYGVEVLIKKMKAYYSKEFSDEFINEIKEKYKNNGWYKQIPKNINSIYTLTHRISNGLHFCFMEEIKMINKFLNRANILNGILKINQDPPFIIDFKEIKDNMEKMEKMEKILKFDKYFESELYKKEINNIIQYCIS